MIELACICLIAGRWEEVAMSGRVANTEFTTLADELGEKEDSRMNSIVLTFFVSVTGDTVVKRSLSMV